MIIKKLKAIIAVASMALTVAVAAPPPDGCLQSYVKRVNPRVPDKVAQDIELAVRYAAYPIDRRHHYYVHPYVLMAIIKNESAYRHNVGVNYAGAHGLMQVIPKWHQANIAKAVMMSDSSDVTYDIATNVYTGAEAFRSMITRAKGDRNKAIQFYGGYPTLQASLPYRNKLIKTIKELQLVCG